MKIVACKSVFCSNKRCGCLFEYKESDIKISYGIVPFPSSKFARPHLPILKKSIVKCPVCGRGHTVESWLEYDSEIFRLKDDVDKTSIVLFVISILSLIASIVILLNS